MSFILEALKRADRERRLGRAPDLSALYQEKGVSRSRRWPWLWAGVVLVVSALIVALILRPKAPSPGSGTSSNSNSAMVLPKPKPGNMSGDESIPKSAAPSKTAGATSPVDSQMRASGRPARVSSAPRSNRPLVLEARITEQSKVPAKGRETASVIEEPETTFADPDTVDIMDTADIISHPRVSLEPADTPLLSQPVSPEPKNIRRTSEAAVAKTDTVVAAQDTSGPEEPIPLITELPLKIRNRFQKLEINVHVYYPDPVKCFVFINARRYQAGDRIGVDGPLLEEIIPDGVVINYGDGRARIQTRR